jgi:hypothetical protein
VRHRGHAWSSARRATILVTMESRGAASERLIGSVGPDVSEEETR